MTDQIFKPRPEAQATTWDALMPPVKMAVRDLLVRIHGAHHSVRDKNTGKSGDSSMQQTGNCFLVCGSRGTGKTTVLLNAQRAVSQKLGGIFFKETTNRKETPTEKKSREDTQKNAKELSNDGIIWLDILNLEPIPSEANLLTVLLTQVRNALHSHCDKRQRDQRSIFEEEANSAQQLLKRLIADTTLMWQNISEPDTRNISARQVKAADIYAGFQGNFNKAMDKLIEELSDTRSSDSNVSIVLPIDNIDRSTEHLQSIVKLAQLVSHPNLWLVMAGDRVEVETFLERAYWKELIRSSDGGTGARGKIDSDGEDEALVMARRQANATAQKLWPANHRVEIDFLKPEQTLAFEHQQGSVITAAGRNIERTASAYIKCDEYEAHLAFRCKCYSAINEKTTIKNLLANIPIPTTDEQRKGEDSGINLLNLFYVEKEVSGEVAAGIKPEYLTRAAHHGLSLPARSVLDLWQLLDWLINDCRSNEPNTENKPDFRAEKVARTMLRTAISSSDMANGIAQDLQTYILRRGENHGTILYFDDTSLNVIPMISENHDFEYALEPVFSTTKTTEHKSQLVIRNIEDIVLSIQWSYSPIQQQVESSKNKYPQPFVTENAHDNEKRRIELPPLVAAWLMVLYDILVLAEATASSWVIGDGGNNNYPNVSVRHFVIQAGKNRVIEPLYWTPPFWGIFLGRNIFSLYWKNFRKEISEHQNVDSVTRLLAAGWVYCVLKTSIELIASIDPQFTFQIVGFKNDVLKFKDNLQKFNESVQNFESRTSNLENENDAQKLKDAVQKINDSVQNFESGISNLEKESDDSELKNKVQKFNDSVRNFESGISNLKKENGDQKLKDDVKKLIERAQKFKSELLEFVRKNSVPEFKAEKKDFEIQIMNAVNNFYQLIQETKKSRSTDQYPILAAYEVMLATEEWLKTEFIYFLSYAYVPIIELKASGKRFDAIWRVLSENKDALTAHWQENSAFILARIEERFEETEDADNGDTEIIKETITETIEEEGNKKTIKETIRETKKAIEPVSKLLFADLYGKLKNPNPSNGQ